MRPQGLGFSLRRASCKRLARLAAPAVLALLGALAGCGPPGPRVPPALPRPGPGYERLGDSLALVDPAVFVGRRIALDPGHGGFFRGALGVRGLTEAEVNLAVGLKLRDLLERAGATVLLTRATDRDFLTPTDSSLRSDLTERMRLANAFGPDLFVSIHHNADAGGLHDVNETQTYYKLGDEGPSLDAAESIHRSLVRNVGIEKNKVVPGNYFVLRNSDAPAVLTESSYLTNPDVEARLALPEKQELEAEALYIGLARHFAHRPPVVREFLALDPDRERPDSVFRTGLGPALAARIAGAFDRVELRLDGDLLAVTRHGDQVAWHPDRPLTPGRHEAAIGARLAGQGAARERRVAFIIARPARSLAWQAFPAWSTRAGGLVGVRVQALDAFGFPVKDSLRVRFRSDCGCDSAIARNRTLRDGVAWGYLKIAPARRRPERCARLAALAIEVSAAGRALPPVRASIPIPLHAAALVTTAFLTVVPGDTALTGAPGSRDFGSGQSWVNRDGFARFPLDSAGRVSVPALPGYRPWAEDTTLAGSRPPTRWAAIAGGALRDRRIVIDPDGGGDDPGGQGPDGTRAAALNLEIARMLAGQLAAAGAEVTLTRTGEAPLSDVQRVQAAEAFHPDRFVRIGHRAEPARLGYYFSSMGGKRWAERTASELARLGLPAPRIAEDAMYPLQQVSCTALYAAPARVDSAEALLLAPGTARAEAYALYLGLAREWVGDADWPLDSVEVRDAADRPAAGVPVVLGGALVLETDALGRARFARTEPGPIEVEAWLGDTRVRRVLLDSERGVVLAGPAGR